MAFDAMRIAFMLTSLGIGGTEKQVVALAERMRSRGHDVLIVVLSQSLPEEWSTPVDVVHLNLQKTALSVLRGVERALPALRLFRPEILHCHNFHGNILGRVLGLMLPGVRVISTIHNVYEGGWRRMAAYRLTDPLSRRTVAVCQAAAERMIEVHAVPCTKCEAIANGIDAAEFAPNERRRVAVRGEMDTGEEFVWLAVGRIVPAKDCENLLRAFATLRCHEDGVQLWIAGEGSGLYAGCMHALAAELGLADCVRWLGLCRDIPALLDAADAFVLASAWEGMPLALGEAMAMEKPVVATDVGGVRELVGGCGVVVPAAHSGDLARVMLKVMRGVESGELRYMGPAARQRVVENFSLDAAADKWESKYRAVLVS